MATEIVLTAGIMLCFVFILPVLRRANIRMVYNREFTDHERRRDE